MGAWKFSAKANRLGFTEGQRVEHSRSRWHGTRFWIADKADAIPARIRSRTEPFKLTPKTIAALAVSDETPLPVYLNGQTFENAGRWRRRVHVRLPGWDFTRLSLAIDADMAEWIERLYDRKGSWFLYPGECKFTYRIRGRVRAVVMAVRLTASEMDSA